MTQIIHSSIPPSRLSIPSREQDISQPNFVKNEIVKGVILKSISSNSVMLLVKGKKLTANTHVHLNEGSTVTLKVEKIYPDPILKLMKIEPGSIDTINSAMILNGIKKNLWKTIIENMDQSPLSTMEKESIKELIKDITEKLLLKPTPESVMESIDKSGIGWENKLKELLTSKTQQPADIQKLLAGDLKGLLSKLMLSTEGRNEHFTRLVSLIENIQLLNHLGFEQDGKIFIPLPLQFSEGHFTVAQLLVQSDKHNNDRRKEKTKENGFLKISFLLELSSIGPLRADLVVQGKQISGRFLTAKKEVKYTLEKKLSTLIDALKKRGFVIFHMECHVKESRQVKDTLIKEIIREGSYNFNLVA